MKLRYNDSFARLARLFQVKNTSIIAETFKDVLEAFSDLAKSKIWWPSLKGVRFY
jgi:hypothetical protein